MVGAAPAEDFLGVKTLEEQVARAERECGAGGGDSASKRSSRVARVPNASDQHMPSFRSTRGLKSFSYDSHCFNRFISVTETVSDLTSI